MDLEYYWRSVPAAFGDWDLYGGELSATKHLDSAGTFFGEEVFKSAAPAAVMSYRLHHQHPEVRTSTAAAGHVGVGFDSPAAMKKPPARRARGVPKAVDEDLYKIPPALLYQKPKRNKRMIMGFWSGCLGINCVA